MVMSESPILSKRWAIINGITIENVFVADEDFKNANYPSAIECPNHINVGDQFVDGEFIRVEILEQDVDLS